ncbi:hypothetical protein AB6A23_12135 [Paenibacillus tarimensis]
MTDKKESKHLKGKELTREQLSDVYTAGTSDGVIQLADEQVKINKDGERV